MLFDHVAPQRLPETCGTPNHPPIHLLNHLVLKTFNLFTLCRTVYYANPTQGASTMRAVRALAHPLADSRTLPQTHKHSRAPLLCRAVNTPTPPPIYRHSAGHAGLGTAQRSLRPCHPQAHAAWQQERALPAAKLLRARHDTLRVCLHLWARCAIVQLLHT